MVYASPWDAPVDETGEGSWGPEKSTCQPWKKVNVSLLLKNSEKVYLGTYSLFRLNSVTEKVMEQINPITAVKHFKDIKVRS